MKFTPKTEQELNEVNLLADGETDFQVIKCAEKHNDQYGEIFDLVFKAWDVNGKEGIVTKGIFNNEKGLKDIFDYCASTGNLKGYDRGELIPPEELGKTGKFILGTMKDKKGYYRNFIKKFVPKEKVEKFKDDDITM